MDRETGFIKGFFYKNPILVGIIGIGPAVAAAYTLKNGIAICVIMLVLFVATGIFSYFVGDLLPDKLSIPSYVVFSAGMLVPAYMLCEKIVPGAVDALGVFAPLMAVNTMIISRSDSYRDMKSLKETAADTFGNIAGFATTVLIVSAVRELLAFGTLLEHPIAGIKPAENLRLPFAGYIILGIMAAVLRKFRRHIRKKREERIGL
ncbi:MAG: hypothetical protein IJL87_01535 [Clostridia bacterium]|nr:hypothetical protein [Clostridia bacterium]